MTTPTRGHVFMDGVKLHGVRAVSFRAGVDEIAEVTLTLYADAIECDVGAEVTDLTAK